MWRFEILFVVECTIQNVITQCLSFCLAIYKWACWCVANLFQITSFAKVISNITRFSSIIFTDSANSIPFLKVKLIPFKFTVEAICPEFIKTWWIYRYLLRMSHCPLFPMHISEQQTQFSIKNVWAGIIIENCTMELQKVGNCE